MYTFPWGAGLAQSLVASFFLFYSLVYKASVIKVGKDQINITPNSVQNLDHYTIWIC